MAGNYFDQFDAPVSPATPLSASDQGSASTAAGNSGGGNFFDQFDTPAPAAPAPETIGRVAGITGRALASGAAAVPSAVLQFAGAPNETAVQIGAPIAHTIRQKLGWDPADPTPPPNAAPAPAAAPYEPKLSDFIHPSKWQDAVNFLADKAGLAKPETPGERIYSRAVEAVPSAVLAPEAPVMGALSAAAGGGASQAVAEAGGSPLAQTLAGLAVGSVPGVASGVAQTGRAMLRDQADTAGRLADAAANGTQLTAGQATGSKFLQRVEGASSKVWGGAPITHVADAQSENLGGHIDKVVENLSSGGDVSPTGAGNAINAGAATAKQNMRAAEKAAYDRVDQLVPPQTPIDMSGTLAQLEKLATPTAGATAISDSLISWKIANMRDNLRRDFFGSQPTGTGRGEGYEHRRTRRHAATIAARNGAIQRRDGFAHRGRQFHRLGIQSKRPRNQWRT